MKKLTLGVETAGLDPKSRVLLQVFQRRWAAFREAEHGAMAGPWRQDRGTIIRVLTVNADPSAIKERVQEPLRLRGLMLRPRLTGFGLSRRRH